MIRRTTPTADLSRPSVTDGQGNQASAENVENFTNSYETKGETSMYDILIQQMRTEVTRLGAQELRTPQEVDATLPNSKGTMLVVVNSTCGCAAGAARPALGKALQQPSVPDKIVTVFAGLDKEATAQARSYFENEPPSSPSFALLRDGKLVKMIPRSNIEGRSSDQVAAQLVQVFNEFCEPARQSA